MKSIKEHVDFNILLNEFSTKVSDEKLEIPAKLSYAIYKNVNKLSSTVKYFEKQRGEILDKYIKKDKDGNQVIENNLPILTDQKKADADYKNLLELDADVDLYKTSIQAEDLLDELKGNHQTLTMLWAIIDILNPSKETVVKELTHV